VEKEDVSEMQLRMVALQTRKAESEVACETIRENIFHSLCQ
jgi:hypothetical protein